MPEKRLNYKFNNKYIISYYLLIEILYNNINYNSRNIILKTI